MSFRFKMTAREYFQLDAQQSAVCLHCGIVSRPLEPDATHEICPLCGVKARFGLEAAFLRGLVAIDDECDEYALIN